MESPILTVKQVAPLRQYQAAYAGGHAYVRKVTLGRVVGDGGRGLGVDRDEQHSATLEKEARHSNKTVKTHCCSDNCSKLLTVALKGDEDKKDGITGLVVVTLQS